MRQTYASVYPLRS